MQRLADYRPTLLNHEVYPISFIWHTDFWTTASNILQDALNRRRPEGFLDATKDFMLDRFDDALEPLARQLSGKSQWGEMKENGRMATESRGGGAHLALEHIAKLAQDGKVEIHVAGHSAGSIFHAPIVRLLTAPKGKIKSGYLKGHRGCGLKIESCTLWAPACTIGLFKDAYLPAIRDGSVKRFALFTLTDQAENDDHCARIYHKSLLYLVSNAFEAAPRIPLFRDGEPILGMEKFIRKDQEILNLFKRANANWILGPNTAAEHSQEGCTARHHGDFDDDKPTVMATLARILGKRKVEMRLRIMRSASSLRETREQFMIHTPGITPY